VKKKMKDTNNKGDSSLKNFSALTTLLQDHAGSSDIDAAIGIYADTLGEGKEYTWNRLCGVYLGLNNVNLTVQGELMEILAQIHAAKHTKKVREKGKEDEENYKHKAFFVNDNNLYLEILTTEGFYKFAHMEDGEIGLTDAVGDVHPVELPISQDGEFARIVQMPDENIITSQLLTAPELLQKIEDHITEYCDLDELDLKLCSYYPLFTWFYRKVNTVGYLRFKADTGKGKSRMLKVIGDLCFYPLTASGAGSFSGMMRMNERWHGTLIIDEADMSGDKEHSYTKYSNLGFEAGKYYILSDKRNPRFQEVFDPFGPKIFGMRESFNDMATEGRVLSISPYETSKTTIPILLRREYYEDTKQLRNEIARFVLAHWQDIDGENLMSFQYLGIEPRLQQLAMPLSILFQLWSEGKGIFTDYILKRQKDLKRERAQSWHGSIFNLVLGIAKGEENVSDNYSRYYTPEGEIQAVTPSMIAKTLKISAKEVTRSLRSIGFEIERRWINLYALTEKDEEEKYEKKRHQIRGYTIPNPKIWKEVVQRYYCNEDEEDEIADLEIPEILKSKNYAVRYDLSQPSQVSPKNKNVTGVTVVTGTDTEGGKKNVCDYCGIINNSKERDGIRPEAIDVDFQARQDKEAVNRSEVGSNE
jgi:hypothetical protein